MEKLIKELPSVPADWSTSREGSQLSNGISFQHVENGTSLRETQSMLLERIASEMNRLKFYITHAQVHVTLCSCMFALQCIRIVSELAYIMILNGNSRIRMLRFTSLEYLCLDCL